MTENIIQCVPPQNDQEIVDRLELWIASLRQARLRQLESPLEFFFDMGNWCVSHKDEALDADSYAVRHCKYPEGFCGTAACALGTAALSSPLQELGLRLDFRSSSIFCNVGGKQYMDTEAAKVFFGLTLTQANMIVWPTYYERSRDNPISIVQVIERIKTIQAFYQERIDAESRKAQEQNDDSESDEPDLEDLDRDYWDSE